MIDERSYLRLDDVRKKYGAVQALNGVSLRIEPGAVLGLVGENGAGKSTLIGVLGGTVAPDSGAVVLGEERWPGYSPRRAVELGIAVVYQELSLCSNLSVASNVFLGSPPSTFGVLDRKRMHKRAAQLLESLGAEINPRAKVENLRIPEQQLTEIARALAGNLRFLVLDEPTSALGQDDFSLLRAVIDELTSRGVGVVFVSHRLAEVFALADRIAVMRDGELVADVSATDVSSSDIAALMVGAGGPPKSRVEPTDAGYGHEVAIALRNATRAGKFRNVNLDVRRGEIVGIAGVRGAGRHELADAIVGLESLDSGAVLVEGREIPRMRPRLARKLGIAYVPQDRKVSGLISVWNVRRNLALGNLDHHRRAWGIPWRRIEGWARGVLRAFSVRPEDPAMPIMGLSGGNQQKVVLARNMSHRPRVLVALEPTRGVDIGVKEEIRTALRKAAAEGTGILLVDSELTDMIELCDRIYVMHRGEIVDEVPRALATEARIALLAAGGSAL